MNNRNNNNFVIIAFALTVFYILLIYIFKEEIFDYLKSFTFSCFFTGVGILDIFFFLIINMILIAIIVKSVDVIMSLNDNYEDDYYDDFINKNRDIGNYSDDGNIDNGYNSDAYNYTDGYPFKSKKHHKLQNMEEKYTPKRKNIDLDLDDYDDYEPSRKNRRVQRNNTNIYEE